MNYCSHCGAEVLRMVPPGDNRQRYVCSACEVVHYQNPNIVTGCMPVWNDQVLLCKRAIEPRSGLWTLPAGFMELGETVTEAALRETMEEANARVAIQGLYVVINLPHVNQVFMLFRSSLLDLDFAPGPESLTVELFSEQTVPWDTLAFGMIRHTLTFFFEDRQTGNYPLHMGDIEKGGNDYHFRSARIVT
ncbi:MAG: NUDIX hydrolase [Gammaproteobacteria bacterium]